MAPRRRSISSIEELTMSDRTLLLNIEDCIGLTFGPLGTNCVNLSMMHTVLNILCRHMRILEKNVEIRFKEEEERIQAMMQDLLEKESEDSSEFEEDRKKREGHVKKSKSDDALTSDDQMDGSTKAKDDQEKKSKKGKAKAKSEAQKIYDVIKTTDRSDVKELYVKKGKDIINTKKADDDADTVSDTKKIEDGVDKKDKKKDKSKRSEGADDVTPELDETEYSGKGKGKKRKDKSMAEMPEVQEARSKQGKAVAGTYTIIGGISVTEKPKERKGAKDSILVVEKGPITHSYPRIGNIEVVTRSQFELVKSDVKTLMEQSKPPPISFMPHEKQLKTDLATGSATLLETMESMHLNARIKAAEEALSSMAILLTKIASDGTLPPETADMLNQLLKEQRTLPRLASAKELSTKQTKSTLKSAIAPAGIAPAGIASAGIAPAGIASAGIASAATTRKTVKRMDPLVSPTGQRQQSTDPIASTEKKPSLLSPENPLITASDLSQALENLKHKMLKSISDITAKSTTTAGQAHNIAKTAETKVAISQALNSRIEMLINFITEQKELVVSVDAGLLSQMQAFQEQLELMNTQFKDGLKCLDRRDQLESSAVAALKEQHDTIKLMVDETVDHNEKLVVTNRDMKDELRGMLDWMNLICREKADWIDVKEGLKDKVDLTELQGLLCEDVFEVSRNELNKQLEKCLKEFAIINSGWMETLEDQKAVSNKMSNLTDLYILRTFAMDNFRELKSWLERLEDLMGDPQLALLTCLLSRGAYCGTCLVAAQMVPFDKNYKKPPPLPLLPVLAALPKAEEPAVDILRLPDNRKQIIKRWVGGSHTLMKHPRTSLPQSESQPTPTRHYIGSGIDGRMYKQEEVLQACAECNQVLKDKTEDKTPQEPPPDEVGAGDQGPDQTGDQGLENKDSQDGDQGPDQTGDQGPENKDSQDGDQGPDQIGDQGPENKVSQDGDQGPDQTGDQGPENKDSQDGDQGPDQTGDQGPENKDSQDGDQGSDQTGDQGPENKDSQDGDQGSDQTGDQGPENKDSDEEKGVPVADDTSVVPDDKALLM